MLADSVRKDPRLAGLVKRWHTWPVIQQQSTGEHMWQVARILLAIWPDAPDLVIKEALFHDLGEQVTGDLPFPVKRDNPVLKKEVNRLEENARLAMCLPWGVPPLVPTEEKSARILKFCDMVEMFEFGLQETLLGNKFAAPIVVAVEEWILEEIRVFREAGFLDISRRAAKYVERRKKEWS